MSLVFSLVFKVKSILENSEVLKLLFLPFFSLQKVQKFIKIKIQKFDVASKCSNSVPLAPYFMSFFTISWLSIFTISCKCIFGKSGIYVKHSSRFRINLFFGENVTMNVCVCVWQCLNHFRTVWNVTIVRNLPNWISISTIIGPNLTIFHPILTHLAPRGAQNPTPSHGASGDGSHFN